MPSKRKQQDKEVTHFTCPLVFLLTDYCALGCPIPTVKPFLRWGDIPFLWFPLALTNPVDASKSCSIRYDISC